ncbi:ABC transporter permease [Halomontanus rarus]|uniref:ABC transporter permease n=1 Tax=Halomontanus rarus TaxID=3034020 RepID=UPI003CE45820
MSDADTRSLPRIVRDHRNAFGLVLAILAALTIVVTVVPGGREVVADVSGVITASYLASAFRLAVPIAFAALGGIFSEKAGVINIGLEGLLIIGAFTAIVTLHFLPETTAIWVVWTAFGLAVLASALVALLFAVVCIEFKADQVIAGLAVWLIALGFAPFASIIVWENVNSPSFVTFSSVSIPVLSELPSIGRLFVATPPVFMLVVAVPLSWYVLNRTTFGKWIEASGEDPKTLDTAGVSVRKVRYAGVVLSGVLCGIGGAGLALNVGQFVGSGETMVDGRGWIGLTAYLIGNYNPIGAFLASFLFAGLDALQIQLQQIAGYDVSSTLIGIIPYVAVVIVLAFVGRTRMPSEAGEHYESDE